MKLLDEIIDLLSDKTGSLTDALLKTKVLMHKIGHKELAEWVNDELNGYAKTKPVPSYRVIASRLMGHIQHGYTIYSNQALPTAHLKDQLRKSFQETEMRESINVLEEFTKNTKRHLGTPVVPELYGLISEGYDGAHVQKAWLQMEPTQIMHALTEVRSRLLDFALGLQDKLGDIEESEVKEVAKGIDAAGMFNNAVLGDNVTIQIGGQSNVQVVENKVKKGDFESLAAVLKAGQVPDADIAELKTALAEDGPPVEPKKFGAKVKAWMGKMTTKAIDGTWTVGLAAGGKLLADALAAHYGWK